MRYGGDVTVRLPDSTPNGKQRCDRHRGKWSSSPDRWSSSPDGWASSSNRWSSSPDGWARGGARFVFAFAGMSGGVREPTPPRRRQLTRMSGGIWGAATPPSEWMGEDGCLKMAVFGGPFPHRSSPAPHLGLPAMLAKKMGRWSSSPDGGGWARGGVCRRCNCHWLRCHRRNRRRCKCQRCICHRCKRHRVGSFHNMMPTRRRTRGLVSRRKKCGKIQGWLWT